VLKNQIIRIFKQSLAGSSPVQSKMSVINHIFFVYRRK